MTRKQILLACVLGSSVLLTGCTRDGKYQPLGMWNDARLKPMEPNPMPGLGGGGVTLQPVPGTVARGQRFAGDPVLTGRSGGRLLAKSPIPVNQALLERGQERFIVYCSPCHGRLGDGQGMIVKRGFPHPPDYAIPRLRQAPVGHYFDVITNGYGIMYSYAQAISPEDRWAIAEYIRVLQAARPVVNEDVYEAERIRARERGIPDPNRGIRLPDPHGEGGANAPAGAAPGGAAPLGNVPSGGPGTELHQPAGNQPGRSLRGADPSAGGTEVRDPVVPGSSR